MVLVELLIVAWSRSYFVQNNQRICRTGFNRLVAVSGALSHGLDVGLRNRNLLTHNSLFTARLRSLDWILSLWEGLCHSLGLKINMVNLDMWIQIHVQHPLTVLSQGLFFSQIWACVLFQRVDGEVFEIVKDFGSVLLCFTLEIAILVHLIILNALVSLVCLLFLLGIILCILIGHGLCAETDASHVWILKLRHFVLFENALDHKLMSRFPISGTILSFCSVNIEWRQSRSSMVIILQYHILLNRPVEGVSCSHVVASILNVLHVVVQLLDLLQLLVVIA